MAKTRNQIMSGIGVDLQTQNPCTASGRVNCGQIKYTHTPDPEIPLFHQHFYSLGVCLFLAYKCLIHMGFVLLQSISIEQYLFSPNIWPVDLTLLDNTTFSSTVTLSFTNFLQFPGSVSRCQVSKQCISGLPSSDPFGECLIPPVLCALMSRTN